MAKRTSIELAGGGAAADTGKGAGNSSGNSGEAGRGDTAGGNKSRQEGERRRPQVLKVGEGCRVVDEARVRVWEGGESV